MSIVGTHIFVDARPVHPSSGAYASMTAKGIVVDEDIKHCAKAKESPS